MLIFQKRCECVPHDTVFAFRYSFNSVPVLKTDPFQLFLKFFHNKDISVHITLEPLLASLVHHFLI